MKLTEELYERGLNQKEKCSIIDDDYVLIKKKMHCTDDYLETYINSINEAKKSGINIASIVDYRLIDGKTEKFSFGGKEISYTQGIFIEDRAKGTSEVSFGLEVNDSEGLRNYTNACEKYITELEKKANADQSLYDKLASDYVGLSNFNLTPDPKPTNFFFDEEKGYTIIDVLDGKSKSNQYLSRYLLIAAFGYGIPNVYGVEDSYRMLSESQCNRYNKAKEEIFRKVIISIEKLGLEDEYTKEDLEFSERNFAYDQKVLTDEELEEYINNFGKQR